MSIRAERPTYREWARHVGTAIIPARPRKPKDKAKVEVGVQVAQRWILACIRNETFFSLDALNTRIAELLERLNDRPMRTFGGKSRRELFEHLDRPVLMPLPSQRFVYGDWKTVRVNIDYHVDICGHYYSVPYALARRALEARFIQTTIELFDGDKRVASHVRSHAVGQHTTCTTHMPKAHRANLEWSPSRLVSWAASVGPQSAALVEHILASRPHPEQGYRSCLGILRLSKRYSAKRLEAACGRALDASAQSYRHVASILKNGLDQVDDDVPEQEHTLVQHKNIRGAHYYQQQEGDDDYA